MQVVDCRTLSRLELGAAAYVATPPTTPGSAPRPSARLARCGCVASACSLATTGVPAVAVKLELLVQVLVMIMLALVVVAMVLLLAVTVAAPLPPAKARLAMAGGKARAGGRSNGSSLAAIPPTATPATATSVLRHETQELDGQTLSR